MTKNFFCRLFALLTTSAFALLMLPACGDDDCEKSPMQVEECLDKPANGMCPSLDNALVQFRAKDEFRDWVSVDRLHSVEETSNDGLCCYDVTVLSGCPLFSLPGGM